MKNSTVINTHLAAVTQQSGVELTEAEAYALFFSPYMQQVADLCEQSKLINKENPSEKDAKEARRIRLALVTPRKDAERKKDELKEVLLIKTNLIQSLYNVVKNTSQLTEGELMEVEKHQERKEAERKASLQAERSELLSAFCDPTMFPLADMAQDAFEQLLNGQKLAHEARIAAEQKAEAERIEAARLEAERIENQRIENERLKKEAEAREAEIEAERKEAAAKQKALEEAARKEREEAQRIQREADEKARKEREQLQSKLDAERKAAEAAKAELDRKEREAKAESDRKQAEQMAAEKKAAAAPDKEKLLKFSSDLKGVTLPSVKTAEAKQIVDAVGILLNKVNAYIEEKAGLI